MQNFCRGFIYNPHVYYYIYQFLIEDDFFPHVAPFLSIRNFAENCAVQQPIFNFPPSAYQNIQIVNRCKQIIDRLDTLIKHNDLHRHTCLILQAGSQATMRLASKMPLRFDWNTTVEIPFCLFITQNGFCSRVLDFEDLKKQEEWLATFEEVLLPMDNVEAKFIPIIAPQQTSKIVKDALMKAKKSKIKYSISFSHNGGSTSSTTFSS